MQDVPQFCSPLAPSAQEGFVAQTGAGPRRETVSLCLCHRRTMHPEGPMEGSQCGSFPAVLPEESSSLPSLAVVCSQRTVGVGMVEGDLLLPGGSQSGDSKETKSQNAKLDGWPKSMQQIWGQSIEAGWGASRVKRGTGGLEALGSTGLTGRGLQGLFQPPACP